VVGSGVTVRRTDWRREICSVTRKSRTAPFFECRGGDPSENQSAEYTEGDSGHEFSPGDVLAEVSVGG
jgi:hypothetical protein